MAISFVGAASTNGGSSSVTSIVSTLPTGISANDLIIIAVQRSLNYAISATPTGYTALDNVQDAGSAPAAAALDVYYRFADGSETTTGPTFSIGTASRMLAECAVYRGVDTTTPFIAHGTSTQPSSSANIVSASLTNTNANAWAVFTCCIRQLNSPVSFTPPTGMTEQLDDDAGFVGTANVAAELADTAGIIGSTGSVSYTATCSGSTAIAATWLGILTPATGSGPQSGAEVAAGTGAATASGFATHSTTIAPLTAAGAGAAGISASTPAVVTAAGVGAAFLGNHDWQGTESWTNSAPWPTALLPFVTHISPALISVGAGTATISGLATHPATRTAAGVGGASVVGTVGIVVSPHVATQATVISNGLYSAAVLAVPAALATLTSDGTAAAALASNGIYAATLLPVPTFDATIQTT